MTDINNSNAAPLTLTEQNVLQKHKTLIEQVDKDAKVALIFKQKFKPTLTEFLANNKGHDQIIFPKNNIINERCNYDMRQLMDYDMINDISSQGYLYQQQLSDSEKLVFTKQK